MSVRTFSQRVGRLETTIRRKSSATVCPFCGGPHRVHLPRVLNHCGIFEDEEDTTRRYVFCQHCGMTARGRVDRQPDGSRVLTGAMRAEIPYI